MTRNKNRWHLRYAGLWMLMALVAAFAADLVWGSVSIPLSEVIAALIGQSENETYQIMVVESRLPRALTAMLSGAALAVSGLLMQTMFRNPVAGPYILGVSSGAGLGVAILLLGSGAISISTLLPFRVLAAGVGAGGAMMLIMLAAQRIADTATLLIIGLMLGAFASAVTGVLQYFASANALRDFVYWTFGSLDHTHWQELMIMSLVIIPCLCCAVLIRRPLDLMLTGDDTAATRGLNLKQTRQVIMWLSALLAGVVTAFCGPIAFVGIAVPHAVRALAGTMSHARIVPLCIMAGAVLMLLCDLLSRMPWSTVTLPINAVTSLVGAPAVIFILLKYHKMSRYFG